MNGLERSEVPEWPLTFTRNKTHSSILPLMLNPCKKSDAPLTTRLHLLYASAHYVYLGGAESGRIDIEKRNCTLIEEGSQRITV